LIVGLVLLAFAGGRVFGRIPPATPVPTVSAEASGPVVPAARVGTGPDDGGVTRGTPAPLPAAFVRAPVVCLDAGHGGPDRGFRRFFDNGLPALEEGKLALGFALELADRLRHRGYQVVLTRESDAAVNTTGRDVNGDGRTAAHDAPDTDRNQTVDELQARINICNGAQADLLVSMHVNGYSTQAPHGYETWFTRERPFGERNAVFATLAYAHLKEQLGRIGYVLAATEERGVLPDTTANVQNEPSLFKHFIITGPEVPGVITPSAMPGAIVETLFVSNDGDVAVLSSPEGQEAIVTAYENAIEEYFERYPPEAR
jgi:N-acetylmuramoyl-L-alanine amidase